MTKKKQLIDEYSFPGARPLDEIKGVFGDHVSRIIPLKRTQKKRFVAVAAGLIKATTTSQRGAFATCRVAMQEYTLRSISGALNARSVKP